MARRRRARAALAAAALALAAPRGAGAELRGSPHLVGTVVSSDAARSLAVVEETGVHRVVRVGAALAGATVVEIRSDALLLRRGDRLETLDLQSAPSPQAGAASSVPASPAAPDGDPGSAAPSADLARSARSASGGPVQRRPTPRAAAPRQPSAASAPSDAASPRSNDEIMAQLAAQAHFAPVLDNQGKLRGVALLNVVPDSMLERLGLRSDDVVTGIGGVRVDSSGAALNAARGLDHTRPVKLDVERHGVPIAITVDPRSL